MWRILHTVAVALVLVFAAYRGYGLLEREAAAGGFMTAKSGPPFNKLPTMHALMDGRDL